MKKKRKRKKLLKPKGSCRFGQCRQPSVEALNPGLPISQHYPHLDRCEKHQHTPYGFEKYKGDAILATKQEAGDYAIMTTTLLGKTTIGGITLLAVLGLSAVLLYEQKQIDTLKTKATPVKEVIVTATPTVATVSAKPTTTERASSLSITKVPTRGVLK